MQEAAMPKVIQTTAEKLRKLAGNLGQLADRISGQPAPKLVPIPVPAKTPGQMGKRR
jgi:hypothetical protein